MKSTQYSEKTLDHFRNPRNVGTLEGENVAVGKVGNPVCGDLMEMFIDVEKDRIKDIKFQTFGCGSAVATSSMITELVKGMSLDEAMEVTRGDVADALEGLPPIKMHCSNLAADALHDAIRNWRAKQGAASPPPGGAAAASPGAPAAGPVKGEEDFLGKGVYRVAGDLSRFDGLRVLILDRGDASARLAVDLSHHTGRVVFMTPSRELSLSPEVKNQLKTSDVKVLLESELLEVRGLEEVERVLVHDLNEDQEYELFVDALINLGGGGPP